MKYRFACHTTFYETIAKYILEKFIAKSVSMQLPVLMVLVTICSTLLITEASSSTNDGLLRMLVKILQEDVDWQNINKVSDGYFYK